MKNKNIHLDIPSPCHEKWSEMTPAEQGRFCNQCAKNVIDFTKMSDRQIIQILETNQSVCGRFHPEQLNRPLGQIPHYRAAFFPLPQLLFGFLALSSPSIVFAQNTVSTEISSEIKNEPSIQNVIEGTLYDSITGEALINNVWNSN